MLQVNPVKERLLFLSPVVQAGWEKESTIADFEKMADLGQGAFGQVAKYKHKKSQIIYAIKQMDKKRLKNSGMVEQIKTEIKIMYSLNHDNIVKLFNHFEDDSFIYLVIDYAPGGQLWDKLQKTPGKRIPEKEVVLFVKDLVASLEYLHGKGIIHRDIKPENLLIDGKGHLKLADFGWSNYFKSDAARTTFCGTLDYLAPEMLEGGHNHDHMVDIWAIGVLTYELLTGKSPFSPTVPTLKLKEIEKGTQQNITAVKFDFPKDFPSLAKDLVSKILRKNPKTRLNLSEIKSHPWVKCTAIFAKKKELDPQALINAVTFGQNMADQKKFAQVDTKQFGVNPVFTEEEIIQYARPDSMLDKATLEIAANKNMNIDKQIAEFRQQMGLANIPPIITTTNAPTNINLAPPTNNQFNVSSFSTISEENSPAFTKDVEYKLRIKSDECILLQQEVDRLKKAAQENSTTSDNRIRVLEEEIQRQRSQIGELNQKIMDVEVNLSISERTKKSLEEHLRKMNENTSIPSSFNKDGSTKRISQLEDQLKQEKHSYETRLKQLESKITELSSASSPNNGQSAKYQEIEEVNENLAAQITEYNKLIKRLYEDASNEGDTEKKRMLEDIKTLRSLSSIKQDRIERLETKVKSLMK